MTLTTNYYHRLPSGALRRIPLAPFHKVSELRNAFGRLLLSLSQSNSADSYASLWADSFEFRGAIDAVLSLNGMGGWELSLGDKVSLCIGASDRPPLLATYNLLTQPLTPSPTSLPDIGAASDPPPLPSRKTIADVFPLFTTEGAIAFPRGVIAKSHGEFEAVFLALSAEAQELQTHWSSPHPASLLLHSEDLARYATRLVELFGLDPLTLNTHQLCELALVYQDEPGLLPQLAGLVEFADQPERNGSPIPETPSVTHFLMGAICQSGPQDWRAILDTLTLQELESFQQGLAWNTEAEKKKQRAKDRDEVTERFLTSGSQMLNSIRSGKPLAEMDRHKKAPIR